MRFLNNGFHFQVKNAIFQFLPNSAKVPIASNMLAGKVDCANVSDDVDPTTIGLPDGVSKY